MVLATQPTAGVVIDVSSSDTSEGTLTATQITFTTGNWDTAQVVTVTGTNDFLDDGDVAYMIDVAAAVSLDTTYNGKLSPPQFVDGYTSRPIVISDRKLSPAEELPPLSETTDSGKDNDFL